MGHAEPMHQRRTGLSELAIDIDTDATFTSVRVSATGGTARVIASFRGRHMVVDAPAYAGGPGEAVIPPELLLSAVGSCALGMFDLICVRDDIPMRGCAVDVRFTFSSQTQEEHGVTVYDKIALSFVFEGISPDQAGTLVNIYHANCPIYGSIKVASREVTIDFETR